MSNAVTVLPMADFKLIECSLDTAAAVNDINGGPATVHAIWIDNSACSVQVSYVKLYDDEEPTLGTTEPEIDIEAEYDAGPRDGHVFQMLNSGDGIAFDNLSVACIEENGKAAAAQTAPDAAVKVTLLVS